MPEVLDILFNPNDRGNNTILVGTFPAHVTDYIEGENINGGIPNNIVFEIAPEVKDMTGINWRDENYPKEKVEVDASHMAGREVRSRAFWLTPVLKDPEKDKWKNNRYFNMLEGLQVPMEEDKDGNKKLVKVFKEDVLGLPCYITIGLEKARDENDGRLFPKVFSIDKWEDGERIEIKSEAEESFEEEAEFDEDEVVNVPENDDVEAEDEEPVDQVF